MVHQGCAWPQAGIKNWISTGPCVNIYTVEGTVVAASDKGRCARSVPPVHNFVLVACNLKADATLLVSHHSHVGQTFLACHRKHCVLSARLPPVPRRRPQRVLLTNNSEDDLPTGWKTFMDILVVHNRYT